MNAESIWHPTPGITHIYLRHTLVLSATPAQCHLRCAATGPYQLFLNGALVGRGQGPTLTGAPVWENFDLSAPLQPGENILLVLATAGPAPTPWFAAEGQLEETRSFGTSPLWQTLRADPWEGTTYLALNALEGWTEGRIHPSGWTDPIAVQPSQAPRWWPDQPYIEEEVFAQAVVAFGEVDATGPLEADPLLSPMESAKCVRREAVLRQGRAQSLIQTQTPNRAVFLRLDFGRLVRGFLRLRLRAAAGSVIDLGFALTPDRLTDTRRYVSADGLQAWDEVELRPCRYLAVRLSGCSEPVEIDSISLVERRFAPADHSTVDLASPWGDLWPIGQATLAAARQENYVLETGPADWLRAFSLALNDYCLTGDTTTAAATLAGTEPPSGGNAASLAHALFLAYYYRYSGDHDLSANLLPSVLENLKANPDKENWTEPAFTALSIGALEAGIYLSNWLKADPSPLAEKANRLKKDLSAHWSEEVGLFVDAAGQADQLSNGLVLFFGLAPSHQLNPILENLRSTRARPPADLLGAFFVAAGLLAAGDGQRTLDYIDLHWGRLVRREGVLWGQKSRSPHTAIQPGPDYILAKCLIGIHPAAPGYEALEIRPQRAGQHRAAATLYTERGPVTVEWFWDEETQRFQLKIELPSEGETRVFAPRLGLRFPTVAVNGETVWRNEKVYPNSLAHEVISEDNYLGLVFQSGGHFEIVVD